MRSNDATPSLDQLLIKSESISSTGTLARQYRQLLGRYYQLMIPADARVLHVGCGAGELLGAIDCSFKVGIDCTGPLLDAAKKKVPDAAFYDFAAFSPQEMGIFDYIIISDRLNFCSDVQVLLTGLHAFAAPSTRLVVNCYNTLWFPILAFAALLGLRRRTPASNWLSAADVANFMGLAGWECMKTDPRILWPVATPLLERFLNRWIAPLLPFLCLSIFQVARPRPEMSATEPMSVSVVIPARNEQGNIAAAVTRTPSMGRWTELIFVEGGSKDNTWEEIQRVKAAYPALRIKTLQQSQKGKGNAVREGFAVAEGELLMILDADLTMPPEDLPKYYQAIQDNYCDFANGCRLVYPMESKAMRFLNMIANKFFGVAFSWLLGQQIKDTLCGTKALRKTDYDRIAANRAYFGEFDPFGDFDLLFGADKLNLKIVDIPIHYKDRSYGETNIDRWRHGALLFRMLGFAALKVKFV